MQSTLKNTSQTQYRQAIKKEAKEYSIAIKADFNKLVLSHIRYTMERTPLAALILMLCAIDYLKSFRYGLIAIDKPTLDLLIKRYPNNPQNKYLRNVEKRRNKSNKKPSYYYMGFLRKYLRPINNKYDIKEIYKNLRCGLVHNFSDHIFKYDFIDNRDPNFGDRTNEHLKKYKRGNRSRVKFNIDVYFNDFSKMCGCFWDEAIKEDKIQANIHDIKSYVGFMTVFAG